MQNQLMPVPFYEDTVVLVGKDNQPYVAMKPVVENMGLAWQAQRTKLSTNPTRWGITNIVTPSLGGPQEVVCLPLRKLASWLMTISPNKVKPELRDKIIRYQEKCDDALWDYWTKGSATRVAAPNVSQQIALSRHRVALLKELHRTRDNGLRAALHEQLAQTSRQLGLSVPLLETIGKAAPLPDEYLASLWAALDDLDSKGVPYNHHRKSEMYLALNWGHLQEQIDLHCPGVKLTLDIRKRAQQSTEPKYLDNKPVESVIKNKSVRCSIFESRGKI